MTEQPQDHQGKETPMMKQFNEIKRQYPDALLLFRVGDFYETFGEDAIKASQILGITLTNRSNGASKIELAGIPFHALDAYLPRLVRAGLRVAICEQLEDPKLTKNIVKRGVTDLITPGLALGDHVLDARTDNFLASLVAGTEQQWGVALMDISTGRFLAGQGDETFVRQVVGTFFPKEMISSRSSRDLASGLAPQLPFQFLEPWIFESDYAREQIGLQFGVDGLKGFGIDHLPLAITACGAILHYLKTSTHQRLDHLDTIRRLDHEGVLWLDPFSIKNLELVGSQGTSLAEVLDETITPMGARMLRRWLMLPLAQEDKILQRQEVVAAVMKQPEEAAKLRECLSDIGDLERLVGKMATGRLIPRELPRLAQAIEATRTLKSLPIPQVQDWLKSVDPLMDTALRIQKEIRPDAPTAPGKGPIFQEGVDESLDELRQLAYSGKDQLLAMQQDEAERTGISSLKVGFNHVHGYYFEVTHAHKNKVPADWIRKQTLTNAERYINEDLKNYEEKILGAEEKILAIETQLFAQILEDLRAVVPALKKQSEWLAGLDCLQSFARSAEQYGYRRPEMHGGKSIVITGGRHPVIERRLPVGERYVTNDIQLDDKQQQILVITGPNMSGKSALLRQTALIVLMAQMGSFVPAETARLGIYDRIFTRVGASDNLSEGESTFMVEMNETAAILNNVSDRSLILLDEIGRGTSTYDGISIAWAIVEFLHGLDTMRPRTLFATHYHELNELEGRLERVKNFHVSVKEHQNKIVFLRKLTPGGSSHSFGIHVARMAGMPKAVVKRSQDILLDLEAARAAHQGFAQNVQSPVQLSLFQLDDPVLSNIREELTLLDINTLTPVEALLKLQEIKRMVGG